MRTLKENARQDFFNGSRPPFGYRKVELDLPAAKGRKKKLDVDEAEAAVVRRIFWLCLHGWSGHEMGAKQIASLFNEQGLTIRGRKWSRNRIHQILSETGYFERYYFTART